MVDNPIFRGLEEQYFQGEKIYNYGGFIPEIIIQAPPSPSPSPTPSITPTITPTNTSTSTPTPTPTFTPTNTQTNTPTPSITPSPTPSLYDPDYEDVLNYATSQGWTLPSDGQKTLQNQLVVDLKLGGIWSDLDIFYVFATDGDDNFSLINWRSPGNLQATKSGVSVVRTTNEGYTAGGSGQYLNTNFNPATNATAFTQNDASVLYWDYDNNNTTSAVAYYGHINTTSPRIRSNGTNTTASRLNTSTDLTSAFNNTGTGLKFAQRTNSTTYNMYNGTATPTTYTSTSAAIESFNTTILRYGSGAANYSSNKCSMFGMGASLSGMETDLYNAIDTYMTSI